MQVYRCHGSLLMSVFGKMTLKDKLTLIIVALLSLVKTVP